MYAFMDILDRFFDPLLVFFYRLPEDSHVGFYTGTFVLAVLCLITGKLTMALVQRVNGTFYDEQQNKMINMHDLSIKAISAKDKKSYLAINSLANEYFAKVFFSRAALFGISLWPVPFVLGWMATRFSGIGIKLPFSSYRTDYLSIFLSLYIISRVLLSKFSINNKKG